MDSKSVYLPAATQNRPYANEVHGTRLQIRVFSLCESIIVPDKPSTDQNFIGG